MNFAATYQRHNGELRTIIVGEATAALAAAYVYDTGDADKNRIITLYPLHSNGFEFVAVTPDDRKYQTQVREVRAF